MAPHSSVLAWRIPGTAEQWAAIYGVTQSWTRLKQLSSSRSKSYLFSLLTFYLCIPVPYDEKEIFFGC